MTELAHSQAETERPTIAIVCGGRSSEHEISCVTAGAVLEAINRSRYTVLLVGISDTGAYFLLDESTIDFSLNPDAMPRVTGGEPFIWPFSTDDHTAFVVRDGALEPVGVIDAVFPVLHGPYGEDGTLQGMLDLIEMPYVGNGVLASSAGMDKVATKRLLRDAGIDVGNFVVTTRREWTTARENVVERVEALGYPVFVKPVRAGSSVGVCKVTQTSELDAACATALAEDSKLIIEAAVVGREIECGVLIGDDGEYHVSSVAGEIIVHGHDFYDYAAKYLDPSGAEIVCPADLAAAELADLRSIALRTFETLDCRGLARIDTFFTDHGFVVNEVNTLPGFTPRSMYPGLWAQSGVSYPEVVGRLIAQALAEPVR